MKNFLKQHGLWVLFAAAVLSVAMAVMSVLSANSSPLTNLTGILASPFRAGYTAIANWFNDLQNYYKDTTDLQAENAALRQQIAKMEETIRQAKAEMGYGPDLKVVATGGLARLIADNTDLIDVVDSQLILDGLRIIYERYKNQEQE